MFFNLPSERHATQSTKVVLTTRTPRNTEERCATTQLITAMRKHPHYTPQKGERLLLVILLPILYTDHLTCLALLSAPACVLHALFTCSATLPIERHQVSETACRGRSNLRKPPARRRQPTHAPDLVFVVHTTPQTLQRSG